MRTPLSAGTALTLYKDGFAQGTAFCIVNLIGQGATCNVYDALCDGRSVRLKEFYPAVPMCNRDENGNISCPDQERFLNALARFEASCTLQKDLREQRVLTNAVINAEGVYNGYGTKYLVTTYMNGTTVEQDPPRTLHELLRLARATAIAVGYYHELGFLHLDIKPCNLFRMPETDEMVLLFDFDSAVPMADVQKGTASFSYSENWAAPELLQHKRTAIGPATDLYAIGALIFYSIFQSPVGSSDRTLSAEWDFKKELPIFSKVNPRIFALLEKFFRKTLAANTKRRFHSAAEMVAALDKMISLADPGAQFIHSNFVYNEACFVGREQELAQLHDLLRENNALFLHGIGGIGKTKLAGKYVHENRKNFNTVIYLRYHESLEDTLTDGSIIIENFDLPEKQKDAADAILRKMKTLLAASDLVLLDNFDTDDDPLLDALLECNCKFLITTREDFSDFDFAQMEVGTLDTPEQWYTLFSAYNALSYSEQQQFAIEDMLRLVEGHTMMIELLAKHLKVSGSDPVDVCQRMLSLAGVTGLTDESVGNRKDGTRLRASVEDHLLRLFDVFAFDENETTLLRSLSLLGEVRLERSFFLSLIGDERNAVLDILIQKGWIEWNEISGKISLHQIILDLVYHKLDPTAENCTALTEAMIALAQHRNDNHTKRTVYRKLCGLFCTRFRGSMPLTAEFYLVYCKHIKLDPSALEKARRILEEYPDEHLKLHRMLHLLEARQLTKKLDMFSADDDDVDTEEAVECIVGHLKSALEISQNEEAQEVDKARLILETAETADQIGVDLEAQLFDDPCLGAIYTFAQHCYEDGVQTLIEVDAPEEMIQKACRKVAKFFAGDDYSVLYRMEHFSDYEKECYYQELAVAYGDIESGGADKNGVIHIDADALDYSELANKALAVGNFEQAMEYMDRDANANAGYQYYQLLFAYKENQKWSEAIELVQSQLEEEKVCGQNLTDTYCQLMEIFLSAGTTSDALQLCDEYLQYQREVYNSDNSEENAADLLNALTQEYLLLAKSADDTLLQEKWEQLLAFYLEHDELAGSKHRMSAFQQLYAAKLTENRGYEKAAEQILSVFDSVWGHEESGMDQMIALCRRVYAAIEEGMIHNREIVMRIYRLVGSFTTKYDYDSEDYKECEAVRTKCDYYYLAELDAAGREPKVAAEIWSDAAREYDWLDRHEDALRCYRRELEIRREMLTGNLAELQSCCRTLEHCVYQLLRLEQYSQAEQEIRQLIKELPLYIDRATQEQIDLYSLLRSFADDAERIGSLALEKELRVIICFSVICESALEQSEFLGCNPDMRREKLCALLQKEIEDEGIMDRLLTECDRLLEIDGIDQYLKQGCEEVIVRYRHREVEFRENRSRRSI